MSLESRNVSCAPIPFTEWLVTEEYSFLSSNLSGGILFVASSPVTGTLCAPFRIPLLPNWNQLVTTA